MVFALVMDAPLYFAGHTAWGNPHELDYGPGQEQDEEDLQMQRAVQVYC